MLSARAPKWSVVGGGSRKEPTLFMKAAIARSRRATSATAAEKLALGMPYRVAARPPLAAGGDWEGSSS
jgi:hypothetical protein